MGVRTLHPSFESVPVPGNISLLAIASKKSAGVISSSVRSRCVKYLILSSRCLSSKRLRWNWLSGTSSFIKSIKSSDLENSWSRKRSMNLKMCGCLGKDRPRTELNDSKDEVVLIFASHTDRAFLLFCKLKFKSVSFGQYTDRLSLMIEFHTYEKIVQKLNFHYSI